MTQSFYLKTKQINIELYNSDAILAHRILERIGKCWQYNLDEVKLKKKKLIISLYLEQRF